MSKFCVKKVVSAGAGILLGDIAFVEGNISRVVASLSAGGTSTIEYSIDPEKDIRADPVTGITWISLGAGPVSIVPVIFELQVPVTAIRLQPVTADGNLGICSNY